jgi:hypothetical protein
MAIRDLQIGDRAFRRLNRGVTFDISLRVNVSWSVKARLWFAVRLVSLAAWLVGANATVTREE